MQRSSQSTRQIARTHNRDSWPRWHDGQDSRREPRLRFPVYRWETYRQERANLSPTPCFILVIWGKVRALPHLQQTQGRFTNEGSPYLLAHGLSWAGFFGHHRPRAGAGRRRGTPRCDSPYWLGGGARGGRLANDSACPAGAPISPRRAGLFVGASCGANRPGRNELHAAQRELLEETGYTAAEVAPDSAFLRQPGIRGRNHVRIPRDRLLAGPAQPEADEIIYKRMVPCPWRSGW